MNEWEPVFGETPIDPSKLRQSLKGLVLARAQLNAAEFENITLALDKFLGGKPTPQKAPFTPKWALRVHKEMFGKVWTWAGKLRIIELEGAWSPLWRVQTDFYNLFADIQCWQESDFGILEQAAILHHRAVAIHPFENGNGRWARLLANIWLKQHATTITVWPEAEIFSSESSIRQEYIAALREADKHNLKPLMSLHERYIASATTHTETESDET